MKRLVIFVSRSILIFIVLSVIWVLSYRWIDVPATPLMGIRKFQAKIPHQIQHKWVCLHQISEEMQLAVICAEDQRFFEHNGFDTIAIQQAIDDHKAGKKLRGASTISQQTAKNVFLWPHRSWVRKGLETYFTFLIEQFWSKERILEVYLNSIEMGKGVYGAEAAAQYWFGTDASELNKEQAAAIAAILPNPKRLATPPSSYTQKRIQWIMNQMRNYGTLAFEE